MTRIEREKKEIVTMITLYCKKQHKHKEGLCPACQTLSDYAHKRLDHCRYGEEKTFCAHCPTQCYNKQHKEKMREVMRFSGPRMLLYNPGMVIRHLLHK